MKHVNKRSVTASCILAALLLVCLGTGAAAGQETPASFEEMQMAYQNVLLGSQSYIQCNSYDEIYEEAVMPAEITQWYGFAFDPPLRFEAYSVTDLDMDGSPEILLRLSDDFGYELLRYEDGQVYGYPFFTRAMEYVTAGGEIHGSNGAENFGWYKVDFSAEQMETVDVCWQYDDLDESIVYFIGDTEVSESEFTALNEELWKKDGIVWTEYAQD